MRDDDSRLYLLAVLAGGRFGQCKLVQTARAFPLPGQELRSPIPMKTKSIALLKCAALLLLLSTLNSQLSTALAQGTAFTYQGRLDDAGSPASGRYDLTFSVWNSASGPSQIGSTVTNIAVGVSNGLFTVALDFGAGTFTGPDRWLEIGVRTNGGGAFATLSPRQKLTATPYAITAGNVTGVLSNSAIAGTYSSAVNFSNALNQFTGSFAGNGAGLSNVNAQTFGGLLPSSFWTLNGNSVAPGQFLGSTNDQPLELIAGGWRALRLEPNTNGAPNLIGGAPVNQVDAGALGATISGGGGANFSGVAYPNRVAASFASIGGGILNRVEPYAFAGSIAGGYGNLTRTNSAYSSIGGGLLNVIDTYTTASSIGGGWSNTNSSPYSVIGGGFLNTIGPDAGFNGFSVIGGGNANSIQPNAMSSTIAGGLGNAIQSGSPYSSIAGGAYNAIENNVFSSTVAGGYGNAIRIDSFNSAIGGGYTNVIATNSPASIIGGGTFNLIGPSAPVSTIAGGTANSIQTNSSYSVIGGGEANSIQGGASHASIVGGTANVNSGGGAFIGGGYGNRAENFDAVVVAGAGNINSGFRAFIGSGENNVISNSASYSVVSGGQANTNSGQWATVGGGQRNSAAGTQATIGGGGFNSISTNGIFSTIAGGQGNIVSNNSSGAFIGGGSRNGIGAVIGQGTIGGGLSNLIVFNMNQPTIGGGFANTIHSGGDYSFIGGGGRNTNSGFISLITGGRNNTIGQLADHSLIAGGGDNRITGSQLLPVYAVIGGGQGNSVQTNVQHATIPGGLSNSVAGSFGFAAGRRAKALHDGSFVWADSTDADFASTATNQFSIRAMGGLRLETSGGSATLNGQPILSGTVPGSSLSGTYPNALTFNNAGNSFTGNGAGLTSLSAANISGGTLNDARLSPNVALLNANQAFAGANTFNNPANSFTGNGAGLTNVNADGLGGLGSSNYWQLGGNTGNPYTVLGTRDDRPLMLFAGNQRVLQLDGVGRSLGFFHSLLSGNLTGGASINSVWPGVLGGAIGGGGVDEAFFISHIASPNTVSDDFGTIGGGLNNTVGNTNVDLTDVRAGTIAGGETNRVLASYGTIGGGFGNVASGAYSMVAGGGNNTSSGRSSVVAGGGGRDSGGGGPYPNTASGDWSVVDGGWNNVASGYSSVIGGGANNNAAYFGTVPGGYGNEASGTFSFAAGYGAHATHGGSFVWADSQGPPFSSTADNQFSIRAAGGVRLNTDTSLFWGSGARLWPDQGGAMELGDSLSSGVIPYVDFHFGTGSSEDFNIRLINNASGQLDIFRSSSGTPMARFNSSGLTVNGTFVSSSDRNVKAGFEEVDSQAVLEKVAALPITRWHYTNDMSTPHLGPVAQDFHAAFNVGTDDKHIATVDADGVALAAIQGLNRKLEEKLKDKETELQGLRQRMADLERIVARLANDPK
jgi:hypothetical protein